MSVKRQSGQQLTARFSSFFLRFHDKIPLVAIWLYDRFFVGISSIVSCIHTISKPQNHSEQIKNIILLHFSLPSSFRLDDIEDNSCLRRGVPVAHSIYGVASTINAANYICFLALEKVQQLDHPDVSVSTDLAIIEHNF